MTQQLQVVEYSNQRILTTQQIAEAYNADPQLLINNFNRNKDRYTEGKHYYALEGEIKIAFLNQNQFDFGSRAKILYLWTEKGALMHAKSLNTDKAWAIYEELVDNYFRPRTATDPLARLEAQHQEVIRASRQLGMEYRQFRYTLKHSDWPEKQLPAPREMPHSQMVMLDTLRGKRLTYSQWVAAGMKEGLAERTAKDAIGRLKQTERVSQTGKYYYIPAEKEVIPTENSTE